MTDVSTFVQSKNNINILTKKYIISLVNPIFFSRIGLCLFYPFISSSLNNFLYINKELDLLVNTQMKSMV